MGIVTVKSNGVNSVGRSINDYDGDGKSDVAVFNVGQGVWHVAFSGMRYTQFGRLDTGLSNWQAVPGDYDGDGLSDVGLYNPVSGYWGLQLSSNGEILRGKFGGPDFKPAPMDWDGDGKTDPVVYRDGDGYWVGLSSAQNYYTIGEAWVGGIAQQPVPADYDGDRLADPMVYVESTGQWIGLLSASGYQPISGGYGGPGLAAAPADYDGDGRVDPSLYEKATGTWYVLMSNRTTGPVGQGYVGASGRMGALYGLPVVADYDGDGKADPATYQPSTGLWQLFLSSQHYTGLSGYFGGPDYQPASE